MGRGKWTMEFIENEKKREKTFVKRKKGLIKKAHDFTTLTGVKMGIIIYGPQISNADPPPPKIWPDDRTQLRAIVGEFNAERSRGAKTSLLPDYFVKRCKTYHDAANNLRKANYATRFDRWFNWFNNLSVAEIGAMIAKLDSIHETVVERIALLKKMKNQMIVPAAETVGHNYFCSFDHQNQSFRELLLNPEMVSGISSNFLISYCNQQKLYHEQVQPPQLWAQPNPFEYPGPNFTYQLDGGGDAANFPFSGLVGSAMPNEP